MVEFRDVPDGDERRYREILRYAFSPQDGPVRESPEAGRPSGPFDSFGVYDCGELVSTCKLYELDAWIREGYEQIGGLGAVATPPEHRRNGYVRELCRGALETFERRGAGLVVLWPFETRFYAKLGWASANHRTVYECPPDVLPTHDAAGRMRPVETGDWERLRRAERAHGEGVGLSLRRSERWWTERTLTNWTGGTEPFVYGYERDGEVAGYLVYSIADDETETLTVETLAHADEEAYRALLSFLGTHGAQVERLSFTRPAESALLDRVDEPERVDCEIHPGPMVRLTSVPALSEYAWPAGELDCTLAVTDPLTGETRSYRLRIGDGTATVERKTEVTADTADLRTDIGTLSQIAIGARSVERAIRDDELAVEDDGVRAELSGVFDSQDVYLGEFF